MKNILTQFKLMLTSDDSNKLSSKRVVTFLAFMLISIAFITNLIFGVVVDQKIFDGVIQIVWAGLGVTVGEHLLKSRNKGSSQETTIEETSENNEEENLGDN